MRGNWVTNTLTVLQ